MLGSRSIRRLWIIFAHEHDWKSVKGRGFCFTSIIRALSPTKPTADYSFQVIEHVSNLHEFVGGIARMLKPGGLTIIGTENHHNAWVAVRRARNWLKGCRLPEFQTANHHMFYFSDKSLCRLVERHGLHVEKCLVYTPSLALKRPQYRFRHWYSKLAFYLLHYADEWTGRGGRLLVWCRKPAESRPTT